MRYFIAFFIAIALVILLIVLLFRGGGEPKTKVTPRTLHSYATTDAEASFTIDGPINAEQEHQQVRITVNHDTVTYEHIEGYNGNVVELKTFSNTVNAYTNFLFALGHAGFTRGKLDKVAALNDERGYCPQGDRYIFEFNQGEKQIER
jgi:hypothetical protein